MHMLFANLLLLTLDWWNTTCYFGCFLCHSAILLSRQSRRVLSFFCRENKREEHSPQTETSRTDNVDEDKLSDTYEREPFVEQKAKAARRNFQSTWLEKFKWLRYDNTKSLLRSICIGSSKANPFTSGCINFRTSTLTYHAESYYADLTFFLISHKQKTVCPPKNWNVP